MDYLLGIDVGTNSCKTIVIDSSGRRIDLTNREYTISSPSYGWAEQLPDDWFRAFQSGLKTILDRNPLVAKNISAIGVTGQMVGLTLIDRKMRSLHPAIIWLDQRCHKQAEYLEANFKDVLRKVTYNTMHVYHTLPKILWLKENQNSIWKNVFKIQQPKDYIRLRLTKNWNSDITDASATMLCDMVRRQWSDEILDITGIDKRKLPEIVDSDQVCGVLCEETAREIGLLSGIPVVAGAGDLAAENFAAGILDSTLRLSRLGSSASTSIICDRPMYDPQGISQCFAYFISDKWICDATFQSFGLSHRWFRDTFFGEELRDSVENKEAVYEIMDRMAEQIPIGSEGLFFSPFNSGSPYWNPRLRGSFFGIDLAHNKKHFTRSVFEGIAFGLRDTVDYLDNLIYQKNYEYLLVGGGSKSKIWPWIICDILGKNSYILENADAALGAAMLAGVGSAVFADLKDAINKCVKRKQSIHFNKKNSEHYNSLYTVYKKLHDDLMRESNSLHFSDRNEWV